MKNRSFERGYLKNVKNKENREWSDREKLKIYTLRKKGVTAQEVARKFKTTVIHIYNITRLTKKGLKNECYICGHKLTEKEKRQRGLIKVCFKCKKSSYKYKHKRRIRALKHGLCGVCGINPVIPGYKSCKECISATYRRRIQKGLCGHCGKKPINKKSGCLCTQCLIKNKLKQRRIHE